MFLDISVNYLGKEEIFFKNSVEIHFVFNYNFEKLTGCYTIFIFG